MIRLASDPIDPVELFATFAAAASSAAAIVTFTGVVRQANDGATVATLELQHHDRLTETVIAGLADDAVARFALDDLWVVHRHGLLHPGDPIVFVAAAAPHRRDAFEAVDYVMDRLKTEAPLWKREERTDGTHWLEARDSDHADAARWTVEE